MSRSSTGTTSLVRRSSTPAPLRTSSSAVPASCGIGAVWAFTHSGSVWTQQGAKLTGAGESSGGAFFGFGLALSSDASRALVGGYEDNNQAGPRELGLVAQ